RGRATGRGQPVGGDVEGAVGAVPGERLPHGIVVYVDRRRGRRRYAAITGVDGDGVGGRPRRAGRGRSRRHVFERLQAALDRVDRARERERAAVDGDGGVAEVVAGRERAGAGNQLDVERRRGGLARRRRDSDDD